ncbi:unnamed protein product [Sphenostylis stenocarpa]|uniref:glutathione transferase n=1 Tax=Sphenostylis stenocarpa TaxID=92480 RepID=A0AA86SW00_9FABA|nr:unnamed protein product [Sphenostylis stenocarpa]
MATLGAHAVLPPPLTSTSDPPPLFDGTTRLYISYSCPFAQRVWITRNYKGLQDKIKLVPIDLQNRPTWYKEKVYPENKVPSLEHNGKVLGESLDLIKYVDVNFEGTPLFPSDPAKKEFGEELISHVDTFTKDLFISLKGDAVQQASPAFEYLENALGKFDDGPFLLGQFSLVDIAYIPFVERFHIVFAEVLKHDITEGRPKLAAWLEELNKIDAYTETRIDPQEIIDLFKKRFLKKPNLVGRRDSPDSVHPILKAQGRTTSMATLGVQAVRPPPLTSTSDPPPLFDGTTRLIPCCTSVIIAPMLNELQDKIKLVPIDLQDRPAWYKEKVYPENKVPSLEHNGKVLGESLDLIKYVDANFEGTSLFPGDPAKKEFGEFLISHVDTFNKDMYSSLKGDAVQQGSPAFEYLENALGKFDDGPFFLGQFSLVDIAYIPFFERFQLIFADVFKHDITEGRPKLATWIEEVNKIDAYTQTRMDPQEIVDRYKKRYL